MNKLIILSLFITIILISSNSKLFSQDENRHPIDVYLDSCLERNPSTFGMVDCTREAEKMWNAELNKYYKLLMTIIDDSSASILKESERDWVKYKEKEIANIENIYSQVEGTMYQIERAYQIMEITRIRAMQLKDYYDVLTGDD